MTAQTANSSPMRPPQTAAAVSPGAPLTPTPGLSASPMLPPASAQINRIHPGDALALLPQIADNSVDLAICDGPYGVTDNEWDRVANVQEFNLRLLEVFSRKIKPGGALYLFGKHDCIDFIDYRRHFNLRTRIVWYQPARLAQGRRCYTNNHDIICYFVKGGNPKAFNLDDIRVPQMTELEHRQRCERVPSVRSGKFGKTKFNPAGKNPGDVWGDIKQLTYRSKELEIGCGLRTIQKPEALMERLVRASSNRGDLILDPFCGTGTCPAVCRRLLRNFIAFETDPALVEIARQRVAKAEMMGGEMMEQCAPKGPDLANTGRQLAGA